MADVPTGGVRRFRPGIMELIFYVGLLSAIAAITLAMISPLREAKSEVGGFAKRQMYLTGMTGFSEKKKDYSWYSEEICKHYRVSVAELSDPVTAASNEALGNASPTKFCAMYRGCRDIEALRCVWYKKVQDAGELAFMLLAAGTLLYAIACVLTIFRLNPRIIAAVGMIGGFVMEYGFMHWIHISDALFNVQRTMVFVPYASLTGASTSILVCCGLTTLMPLSTLRMVDHYKEAPEKPPEEPQAGEAEEEDEPPE